MSDIKRFRGGFVLDEHPTGQVVRYSHHMARIEKLEAERDRTAAALWRITCQCGNVELDIHHHAPKCPFRAALEEGGDGE